MLNSYGPDTVRQIKIVQGNIRRPEFVIMNSC
jgi:hypothetical protein